MKILAVHSALLDNIDKQSQVDHWRVYRPMRELAKHTDWQIDHEPAYIPGIKKYQRKEEFTKEEREKAFKKVCEYDIVFSSYHPDPTAYTMLKVARDRAGTQFIMDSDDDLFAINPDNPFWLKMTDEKVYWMQRMIADNDWITTPSEHLAKRYRARRKLPDNTVKVIPNFISNDYQHPEFDNSPNIIIGYFGGSSHFADLHDTEALDAIQKLMHENKNVRFRSIHMLIDTYLPRQRVEIREGARGTKWMTEVFPKMEMDISIGPLLDNIFNKGKSNIKWQESTRAGAVFVASNVGPYKNLKNAVLVENNREQWYNALKELLDETKRKKLLDNARKELKDWELESNWRFYKEFFEKVQSRSGRDHIRKTAVSKTSN